MALPATPQQVWLKEPLGPALGVPKTLWLLPLGHSILSLRQALPRVDPTLLKLPSLCSSHPSVKKGGRNRPGEPVLPTPG